MQQNQVCPVVLFTSGLHHPPSQLHVFCDPDKELYDYAMIRGSCSALTPWDANEENTPLL